MNTIALVDDHVLITKALSNIINGFEDFKVVFEAENGRDMIEKINSVMKPDILLLDISMPIMDGFEAMRWLSIHQPSIKVVTLSMQDDEQSVIRMLKYGAKGYLIKNTHPRDLEIALKAVAEKGFFYSDWATYILVNSFKEEPTIVKYHISDREQEFLQYVATEMTYKEISETMYCSPRTVEGYRDSLFEKLSIKSRVGLVLFAIKHGIVKV